MIIKIFSILRTHSTQQQWQVGVSTPTY